MKDINGHAIAMLWKILDSLLLSIMLLIGAKLTSALSSFEIVFLVNLVAALFAFFIFSILRSETIRPRHPRLHFYRGALGVGSTACFLLSIEKLGLAESTAIGFLAPVVTTLISKYREKEAVDSTTLIILGLNFFSVALVLSGRFSFQTTSGTVMSIGFSIAAMICTVLYNINLKNITKEEAIAAQSIFGSFVSALVLAPIVAPGIGAMAGRLDIRHICLVGLYSALLTLKSVARYFAFRLGGLAKMMSMDYAQVAFTAILGAVFLGQKIEFLAALGIGILSLAGIYQLYAASRVQFSRD